MNKGKYLSCPKCNQRFHKDTAKSPRRPLLLDCGHSMCEGCIVNLSRVQKTTLECPKCQMVTCMSPAGIAGLNPDVYINGSVLLNENSLLGQVLGNVSAAMSFKNPKSSCKSQENAATLCNDCSTREATCQCIKCDWKFCESCFQKVHSVSNALRGHKPFPLQDPPIASHESKTKKPLMCQLHNKIVEYFCESEQVLICSSCAIKGPHFGHSVTTLEEKNKLLADDIESAMIVAKYIVDKMKATEKVLQRSAPNFDKEIQKLADQVRSDFVWLSGILQIREAAILQEISKSYTQATMAVSDLRQSVMESRLELEATIADGQRVLMGKDEMINGKAVLEALKEARDIPCDVVDMQETIPVVRYNSDHSLVNSLRAYGDIESSIASGVTLAPCTEVDDDIVANSTNLTADSALYFDNEDDTDTADVESVTSTVSEKSSVVSAADGSVRDVAVKREKHAKHAEHYRQDRSSGLVMVSHIKSPSDFMVQRCSDLKSLQSLQLNINAWMKRTSGTSTIDPATLNVGDAVLCLYATSWNRARIVGINKSPVATAAGASSGSTHADVTVEVYYFDHGNTDVVSLDKLHTIPPRYQRLADFALHCSLTNIKPKGDVWTEEAIKQFAFMVSDKQMYMQVYHEENHIIQVDLSKPPTDDVADDRPMSVKETLVFLELASFSSKPAASGPAIHLESKYIKKEPKGIGCKFNAIMSHYDGPNCIVVQETGIEMNYLSQLMFQLQDFYKAKSAEVLCPQIGMPCVCRYSDRLWYRAEVIGLPGNKQVQVNYVDFGNTEVVPVAHLRKLDKRFVVLPSQAIRCSLAHVAPFDNSSWSSEAITLVSEKLVYQKTCSITVLDTHGDTLKVKMVVLENARPAVHLNSLLVTEGLAISTGLCSRETLPPGSVGRPLRQTRDKKLGKTFDKKEGILRTKGVVKAVANKSDEKSPASTSEPIPDAKATKVMANSSNCETAAVAKEKTESDVMEVVVSKFYTPSYFFVQLASARSRLDDLMDDLKTACNAVDPNVTSVDVGQCFSVKSSDGKWYRARVSKVITESTFEAHMLDYGFSETIHLRDMRIMKQSFMETRCFAFPCSLADIMPAGDVKWTKTSCETCQQLLHNHKYYIASKRTSATDGVLPIDLNLEQDIPETALEPARKDYFSLTSHLLEIGLALPKRKKVVAMLKSPSEVVTSSVNYAPIIQVVKSDTVTGAAPDAAKSIENPSDTVGATEDSVGTDAEKPASRDLDDVPNTNTSQAADVIESVDKDTVDSERSPTPPQSLYVEDAQQQEFESTEDESVETLPSPNLTYLYHPRPKTDTFSVKPMYVDNSGVIYAQLTDEDSVNTLTKLTDDMQTYYSNDSQYERPAAFTVGQACAAYYEKDKLWCRTRVEAIHGDELQVLYIDYGNSQMVLADNVQADVGSFIDIPQLTVMFVLSNVEPLNEYHGVWPSNVLEFIQDQIVFYECTIEIVEYIDEVTPFRADVYQDGDNIADLLCESMGMAQRCDDISTLVKRSKTIQDFIQSRNHTKRVSLPEPGYMFPVTITHIELPNIVYFQHSVQEVIDADEKHRSLFTEVNRDLSELEHLAQQLNKHGPSAKPMRQLRSGMTCCAQFSVDMCWYRGLLVTVDMKKQHALVYFMDYGNSQEVALTLIRPLPVNLLKLPSQATCSRIAHLQPYDEQWTDAAYEMVVYSCNQTLLASITSLDPHIEAEFFIKEPDTGDLRPVYQQLLNANLARVPNSTEAAGDVKHTKTSGISVLATYMLNKSKPHTTKTEVGAPRQGEIVGGERVVSADEAHGATGIVGKAEIAVDEGPCGAVYTSDMAAAMASKSERTLSWSEMVDDDDDKCVAAGSDSGQYDATGSDGGQYEAMGSDSGHYEATGSVGGQCEAECSEGGQYKATGCDGGQYEATGSDGGHYEAMGSDGGHYEAMGSDPGHYKATGSVGGQYEATGSVGGQYEATGSVGGQYEATGSVGGQYEATSSVGGQYEATSSVGGQYEATSSVGGQYEATGSDGGQYEATGSDGGQYEATGSVGGQYEATGSVGGQYEATGSVGGQYEATGSNGDQNEATGYDNGQYVATVRDSHYEATGSDGDDDSDLD